MTSTGSATEKEGADKDKNQKDNTVTVIKTEKRARESDGGEYDEWAKKLVNRPIPQLQPAGGGSVAGQIFQSGNNTFLIQGIGNNSTTAYIGGDGLPPHNGFDMDSAIGRFTWLELGEEKDKYVPCIYRAGDLYCCVRMAEPVLDVFFKTLPPEISNGVILNGHNLTQTEAKLLSYINSWHCDGFYGTEPFGVHDLLVKTSDLEKYYAFLNFSYQVLHSGGGNKAEDFNNCGFVKVNNDSLIPYTVMSGDDKGIPLFYFEGQIDILNAKSQFLSGWELAYLKLCCKVQGVRKDLISGETLRIVKLVDLKGYFPKRTTFDENNWPAAKSKSLLPKPQHIGTFRLEPRILANDCFDKSRSNSSTLTTRPIGGIGAFATHYTTTSNGGIASSVNHSTLQTTSGLNGILSRNGYTVNSISANNSVNGSPMASVIMGPNGTQIQVPRNQIVAARTTNLSKIRAPGPPADTQKLSIIPEFIETINTNRDQPAYSVRMIIIDKEVLHCINQKPHKSDVYLLLLQEYLMKFFPPPHISIYPTCVSVLKSIGITTYLPNSAQVRVFNAFGFSISKLWELPLITATDAASQLAKLKMVLTPKPTPGIRTNVLPGRLPPNSNSTPLSSSNSNSLRSFPGNAGTVTHSRTTRSTAAAADRDRW